jgi:hypothetical protein
MKWVPLAALAAVLLGTAAPSSAHPAPYSYVDVRIQAGAIDVIADAHIFDLAHDLGIDPPERLLDSAFLAQESAAISTLIESRLMLAPNGEALDKGPWSAPEVIADQQAIRIRRRYELPAAPGVLAITARLFPYDPAHQTFVNIYEGGALASQLILDAGHAHVEYYTDTGPGFSALTRRFAVAGIQRMLSGYDHLFFLIGLLLLGGSLPQLALIVGAFAVAHSLSLSLAALNLVAIPTRLVAPAAALSVVYVGVDNLMIRGGRDARVWIALVFGLVHGFGLANAWGAMDHPIRAFGWSLASFNVGIELGQLLIVAALASALSAVRAHNEGAGRRFAMAGSIVVAAAGACWFIQRL